MKLVLDNPKDIRFLQGILGRDIRYSFEHGPTPREEMEQFIRVSQSLGISKEQYIRILGSKRAVVKIHQEAGIDFDSLWDPMVVLVRQARTHRSKPR